MSMFSKKSLPVIIATMLSGLAYADSTMVNGPMRFDPIDGSAYMNDGDLTVNPWVIPEGFRQVIVSDEYDLDIYQGNDWNDMNTVNETGKQAGRYLYRTHEVRPDSQEIDGNAARNDGTSGGAVSVLDLKTGIAKEVVTRSDWEALDGIVWTPWQTVLFAEEVGSSVRKDPDAPDAESGLVYELKLKKDDLTSAESVVVRTKLGALAHEGIEIDDEGNVYVIDEDRHGSIYKFVPETYGDLSEGQLYALKVDAGKTGSAQWVALDMNQVQRSARVAAAAVGATEFCRPEDLERIGKTLYAALTCEDVDNPTNISGKNAEGYSVGAVLSVSLNGVPYVNYVVVPGKNAPFENQSKNISGFAKVDNLAHGPDGKLWMVEDNSFSDIWVFDPNSTDANIDGYQDGVYLFASLKDKDAEGTGIYFGKDPHTLFVNVQHSSTGNDKTMKITNRSK